MRSARLDQVVGSSARWRALVYRPTVTSTNALAVEAASRGEASGLVLVANRQTAGRGRQGRRWVDRPDGSLALTALVDPPGPDAPLPLAVGLAVADGADAQGAAAQLKWPNDVLVEGGKCCGILVERAPDGRLAIGIGINVDWRSPPPPSGVSSIAAAAGHEVDRADLLADVLVALDRRLRQLDDDPSAVRDDYRRRCVTLGTAVRVSSPAGITEGTALDVDGAGRLQLRTDRGLITVAAGDVIHLRDAGSPSGGTTSAEYPDRTATPEPGP